jgi:hypothetical protein
MNDRQDDGKTGSGFHPSRRNFLTRAGWLAGGMALMGVSGFRPRLAAAATSVARESIAGPSALELDGQFIDFLRSAEGGFPKAEVIAEQTGLNLPVKKHIGPSKFQDIAIQCDAVMPKPIFEWIPHRQICPGIHDPPGRNGKARSGLGLKC